jgi:hypothetical protein
MPNYENTIIYKLCCKNANITDIYIGHTTDMTRRRYRHKACANNPNLNGGRSNCFETIRANGGWENWDMIELEKWSCKDANEAKARERYWIEQLKPSLNYEIPSRTRKEWYTDTRPLRREEDNIKCKKYREANSEMLNEKKREKIQCPHCPSLISRSGMARHKHKMHNL